MANSATTFSVWGKVGEEHLQCPACQDYFRQPKMLSCQHSVCAACLEREKVAAVSKVECPVCWQATALPPEGGVSALRTNFKLVDMVEAAHKQHQRERKTVPVCRTHAWKESVLYCETCRELICQICTSETHRGHEHCEVGAAAYKAKQDAERSVAGIKTLVKDLEEKVKLIEEVERDLKTAAEDARQSADERANEEITRVKAARQRIRDEINATEKERAKILTNCKRDCTVLQETVKSAVGGYKTEMDTGRYAADFDFVALCPRIADMMMLSSRKSPDINPGLSFLKFKKTESEGEIRLGRLVTKQ